MRLLLAGRFFQSPSTIHARSNARRPTPNRGARWWREIRGIAHPATDKNTSTEVLRGQWNRTSIWKRRSVEDSATAVADVCRSHDSDLGAGGVRRQQVVVSL